MRKIISIVLCILVLIVCAVTVCAVTVFAAGSLALTPSSTSAYRGKEFTVTVSVSGIEAYRRGGIEVTYDSKFELLDGKWLIDDASFTEFSVEEKTGTFVLGTAQKVSGVIFELTFRVKEDAEFKPGDVSVVLTLGLTGEGEVLTRTTKITVACSHKYGSWSRASDSKHSRTCTICGHVATADHTYTNDCDTSCNDCGASRTITHAFSEEWTSDETAHWHVCSVCGEIEGKADHVPGAEAGEYTDQLCTECGYVITPALGHQHNYGDSYHSDDVFHWQACLGCQEKTEAQRHVFDDDCDESCNICGYLRRVIHNECETPKFNTTVHWTVCDDCGLELSQGDHVWDGGTVLQAPDTEHEGTMVHRCGLCDAEKTEPIPKLEKVSTITWWAWMLMGFGVGVVLTVAVGLIIILTGVGGKRNKGKFSNR